MDYEWLYRQLVQEIRLGLDVAEMMVEARSIEARNHLEANSPQYMWAIGRRDLLEALLERVHYIESVQKSESA